MSNIAYFLGTYEDWGGASRALLNFLRRVDKNKYRPIVFVTREGNLSKQLAAENIDCVVWELHDFSWGSLGSYLFTILRTIYLFRKKRIELIHMNYKSLGWRPAELIAARILRIPIISHYHGECKLTTPNLKASSAIIVVSQYIADHSNTGGLQTHVIHNIGDFERFSNGKDIRQDLEIDSSKIIISFLGQIKLLKGIRTFLALAEKMKNENIIFLILGEFKETSDDYTYADFELDLKKNPRIKYLGYRQDPENLYATSDIVIMPSTYGEPCAMIMFESGAAGKPLLATNTGGTPEIIRHGVNGFLFEKDDVETLAELTENLVNDADLRKRIGDNAFDNVKQNFSAAPIEKLESLYSQLLKKR